MNFDEINAVAREKERWRGRGPIFNNVKILKHVQFVSRIARMRDKNMAHRYYAHFKLPTASHGL